MAVTAPGVDVQRVVQAQRTATLRHLHDLTRLKRESLAARRGRPRSRAGSPTPEPTPTHGLAWLLVLENLVFAAEAEVRWLDHVETMLARRPARTASGAGHRATTTRRGGATAGGRRTDAPPRSHDPARPPAVAAQQRNTRGDPP